MAEHVLHVPAGRAIVEEGTIGNQMFVLESGRVEVTRSHGEIRVGLATLGPGAIFGELGLLESLPRGATVTAIEDSTVYAIDSSALLGRIAADPMFALRLLQAMAARIRRLNDTVVTLALDAHREEDEVRDTLAEIEYEPPGYL